MFKTKWTIKEYYIKFKELKAFLHLEVPNLIDFEQPFPLEISRELVPTISSCYKTCTYQSSKVCASIVIEKHTPTTSRTRIHLATRAKVWQQHVNNMNPILVQSKAVTTNTACFLIFGLRRGFYNSPESYK